MSYAPAVHAALAADSTLLATLTGGVYLWDALKAKGVHREKVPAAYISGGKMKPHAIVRGRAELPVPRIVDKITQYRAVRQAIEIYLYDDPDAVFTALETAAARIMVLLDEQRLDDGYSTKWVDELKARDATINDALMIRAEYEAVGKRLGGSHNG